jgi:hypothetical protein
VAKATFTIKWIKGVGPAERVLGPRAARFKIAIAWPDLRFDADGKQLTAVLDIPRDQLRVAPDYKPDAPAVVTKVIEPLMPSTEEPPNKVTDPPPPEKELKPTSKRKHRLY